MITPFLSSGEGGSHDAVSVVPSTLAMKFVGGPLGAVLERIL